MSHAPVDEPVQLTQIRQWEAGELYPDHDTFSFGHGFGTALVEGFDQLRSLLDEFDRYASTPNDTGYDGSPFAERVRAALGRGIRGRADDVSHLSDRELDDALDAAISQLPEPK